MGEVLDYYAVQSRATLQCFKNSGATGIAHYLTASMSDPRQINRQELEDALAVGLEVYLMYEMNPTYPGYFTFAQGVQDCLQAQQRLTDLEITTPTIVRFTVDVNVNPEITDAYFKGIESVVTPLIIPGGYGYQRFCEYAYLKFPNVGKHLWQTYGAKTVPLDLWQHLQEDRCGTSVDVNEATVHGWSRETDMAFKDDPDAIAYRKDVADTFTAVKDTLALLAHHPHLVTVPPTGRTSEPLMPPVPGAVYFSASDNLEMIGWSYPDGVVHFFMNGKEVTP